MADGVLPRQGKAFGELKGELGLDQLLVLDKNQRLFSEEPPLEWHPSMAVPRLRALYEGRPDNFLKAAALAPGQRLLDCTLGLGADALLAAAAVGPAGRVLGLEASPAVAAVTAWGLAHQAVRYQHRKTPVADLAARISVLAAEALEYLRSQPDASWDVVYFDPMFRAAQNGLPL